MPAILRATAAVVLAALATVSVQGADASRAHDSTVIEDPVNWTPNLVPSAGVPRPRADALDQSRGNLYVGGLFDAIRDRAGRYQRSNLAAFDSSTGQVRRGFRPELDGSVWAVEARRHGIYVGGTFHTVDGVRRQALVKLDPVTGAVDRRFNARFDSGQVKEVQLVAGTLYVGGSVGHKLMALDPDTGRDTGTFDLAIAGAIPGSWGEAAVYDFAINPQHTRLVATGNFLRVDGQFRKRLFVANISDRRARLASWYYRGFAKRCSSPNPQKIAYLQGVDFSPDGRYFVVVATGSIPVRKSDWWRRGVENAPNTTLCDSVGRFDMGYADPTHQPEWVNYTGGDSVWAVAATGAAVYLQGHFRWLNNVGAHNGHATPHAAVRRGIGAVDPITGRAIPRWDPAKPAQRGGRALLATAAGLWVGSDSGAFAGEKHMGVAFVPLPAH